MADTAAVETAPAAAPAAQAKTPKKRKAPSVRAKSTGPKLGDQIRKVVAASSDRKGISVAAIKKALASGGMDVDKNRGRIKLAIKRSVDKGSLVQTKGKGASGSFKLPKKEPQGKVVKKAKKTGIKKSVKKPAAVKKSAKKPAAGSKKSPAKKLAKKSPAKKLAKKSPAKKLVKKTPAKKAHAGPKRAPAKKAKAVAAKPASAKPKEVAKRSRPSKPTKGKKAGSKQKK
ncbi:histone H1-like [Carcharodon carcharias]|uniref:histone H1-like n=1 Tax=Carcharodon carcharias TaxID=13397 RepID=UPI001B7DAC56|nr:histone H1-like [Carcharodon carcharias]